MPESVSFSGRVAVVGGGLMGVSIAKYLAKRRVDVLLVSRRASVTRQFDLWYGDMLMRRSHFETGTDAEYARMRGSLRSSQDLGSVSGATLVLECVSEDVPTKVEVLTEVERHVAPDAILATNTSSLRVSEIGERLRVPERFVGMHHFHPVNLIRLVELVGTRRTNAEVLDRTAKWLEQLSRVVVRVVDSPGFVGNRLLLRLLQECCAAVEAGYGDPAGFDLVFARLATGRRPFAGLRAVGAEMTVKVLGTLAGHFPGRFAVPSLLRNLAGGARERHVSSRGDGLAARVPPNAVVARCIRAVAEEAALCRAEGIAEPGAIDRVFREAMGASLSELAARLGIGRTSLAAAVAPQPASQSRRREPVWASPDLLPAAERLGVSVGLNLLSLDRRGDSLWIGLRRPPRNHFDYRLLEQLETALELIKTEAHSVLVITGTRRVFSAGADLESVARVVPQQRQAISARCRSFTQALLAWQAPVVAAIEGPCLGAGLELALACDLRLASESAVFGFPEITLGVMPGAGGTQLLPPLVGRAIAARMMLHGRLLSAQEAYRVGLVDELLSARTFADRFVARVAALTANPQAVGGIVRSLRRACARSLDAALVEEARAFWECMDGRGTREERSYGG